ncbi:tripartite motif-containing protein 5-like [Argopecten irradians]|uniref:tripartite motif-containing protein 5-like n=1 Tax=Argopecten irradians TaxID=31199 RepID=UPI003723C649
MAAVPVEKLQRALRCRMCSNVLEDARVLKCGHTFCFLCIKRDYERHKLNKGNCPVCDENYFVRERDPQYLSEAFVVNDVLDILKSVGSCAFCQADDECKNEVHRYHKTIVLHQAISRVAEKDFPRKLESKRQVLDKMSRFVTKCHEYRNEQTRWQHYGEECSKLKDEMLDLLKYGSGKVILEMFFERESRIEEALGL